VKLVLVVFGGPRQPNEQPGLRKGVRFLKTGGTISHQGTLYIFWRHTSPILHHLLPEPFLFLSDHSAFST
jgi:hypothetical protein